MPVRVAKFSIHHDTKALRPNLAISNANRFLVGPNIVILSCGALFLSKGIEGPASIFQIDLSNDANLVFFTRFDDLIVFDDNGFFTSSKSYSIGGVEAVVSGVDGDYRMFINSYGRLCMEKIQPDLEEIIFHPDYPIT
jgi:hypothetical protein